MRHGFFQDNEGNFSSMRLVFLVMIAYALVTGWWTLLNEGSVACLALVSGLVGLAGGLKLGQKYQEKKG